MYEHEWKLDYEYDPIGVMLEEDFYCGDCDDNMMQIREHVFQCPHCGKVYDDHAS